MKEKLTITKDGFFLSGEPYYLASGDIHYFRIYPTEWRRHLLLAKDFGLNTIQTYVPWNLHEPEKGKFDFSGHLDLCAFLELADGMGFKVLLRPSPFLCSECDFGGLPGWLKFEELDIRCSDERYLLHVKNYYSVLMKKIVPYLSTNGGPVIMVAVENEYGGAGYDKNYLSVLKKMMEDMGVDVPFYTTDNTPGALQMGSLDGVMRGSNFRSTLGVAKRFADYTKKAFPEFPFFVGELWAGRAIYWGEPYKKRDPEETAKAYRECLEEGFVNFYMFSGGTNFGAFSGGLVDRSLTPRPGTPVRYIAHTTSYDEDALVTENGLPTEKYYLCRDELSEFLGREKNESRDLPFSYKVQTPEIHLTEHARLFDNLDALTEKTVTAPNVKSFEALKTAGGFVLYEADAEGWSECGKRRVTVGGVADRVTVYDGDEYLGMIDRDRAEEPIYADGTDRTVKIRVLCESVARVNGGKKLDDDPKGVKYIAYDNAKLYGFKMSVLQMKDLSNVKYGPIGKLCDNDPAFFKGHFDAQAGVDTFLDMRGWGRGFVLINGFNIGRFWEIGPQYTLYVPGGLIKEKDNEIVVFDVNRKGTPKIGTLDHAILEGE